jgi:flagellar basal-body rod protein FlgB
MPEPTIQVLQKLVSYSALRQKTISKNIANISTENYQREEVRFNDLLSEQMNSNLKATESRHFDKTNNSESSSVYTVVKDNSPELSSGVNNVNIEKEMADLAENSLMYKFAAKRLSSYFKTLQSVIKGSVS